MGRITSLKLDGSRFEFSLANEIFCLLNQNNTFMYKVDNQEYSPYVRSSKFKFECKNGG